MLAGALPAALLALLCEGAFERGSGCGVLRAIAPSQLGTGGRDGAVSKGARHSRSLVWAAIACRWLV